MRTITDELREAAEELERDGLLADSRREQLQDGRHNRWSDHYSRSIAQREFFPWVGQHDFGSDR